MASGAQEFVKFASEWALLPAMFDLDQLKEIFHGGSTPLPVMPCPVPKMR